MKSLLFLACAGMLFIVACDMGTQPKNEGNLNQDSLSFSQNIQPIFSNNCAFSGCHGTSGAQQGMVLASGHAYSNIVNVYSTEDPNYKRVQPGSADSSFLYLKITNPPLGNKMPQGGSLTSGEISAIQKWIDQGALNN